MSRTPLRLIFLFSDKWISSSKYYVMLLARCYCLVLLTCALNGVTNEGNYIFLIEVGRLYVIVKDIE